MCQHQFQADARKLLIEIRRNNPDAAIILVGHSFGGCVAIELASHRPDLVVRYDHEGQRGDVTLAAIVRQQFELGDQILATGLVPILEPEIDIHCPDKAAAEDMLKAAIMSELNSLGADEIVMLKLTLPETDNLYADCVAHPNVARVVALSGGYSREEANARLARQNGMVASFSRALAEGLTAQQSADEFDATLDASIESIFQASNT